MTTAARHILIAWLVASVVVALGIRYVTHTLDAARADLAVCRGELADARLDAQAEHAAWDVCLDTLVRYRDALDDRRFCALWVEP